MKEHTVRAAKLEGWTGFKLNSPLGNTIDTVRLSGNHVVVTVRTPVDQGARESTVRLPADSTVSVFGPDVDPDR